MTLPETDESHLILDYDYLIFDRGVIDGLESSNYQEQKTPPITSMD